MSSKISVLIRIHDFSQLSLFEQALDSLAAQTYKDVEPIILAQNASPENLSQIKGLVSERFQKPRTMAEYQLHTLSVSNGQDARSALLNLGLKNASGRYVAFLDFDDLIEPDAYLLLIEAVNSSKAAVAVGGSKVVFIEKYGGQWVQTKEIKPFEWGKNKADLFRENFIPIHSFVLDRNIISDTDLYFDESMVLCEDYEFLLRLAAKYPFNFLNLSRLVAIYRARIDAGNTNPSFSLSPTSKDKERLAAAEHSISQRKSALIANMSADEIQNLGTPSKKPLKDIRAKIAAALAYFPPLQKSIRSIARKIGIAERKF